MLQFHHLGLACRNTAKELEHLSTLGYSKSSAVITDIGLGVEIQFCEGSGPRIELVAPLPGSTVLDSWLAQGQKIYHMAYEVADLDETIRLFQGKRSKMIVAPTPAVAFGLRKVSFVMMPNSLLVELIQT